MGRRPWAASWATCLLVLAIGCTPSAGTTAPAPTSTGGTEGTTVMALPGRLFFTHTTEGDVQTALVTDADGTRQLTQPGEVCCVLRKSPVDDRLLVLPSLSFDPPLTGGTLGGDGGTVTPLPRTDDRLSLVPSAWSPDGARIAFEGWDEENPARTGIYTARAADGADLVRVTDRPGLFHDVPLDYSPDGRRLVFYRSTHPDPDPYTGGSLWVINIDGTAGRQISTEEAPPTVWARWSPDGSRILFAAERLADTGPVWTIRPDGSELTTVYRYEDGGFAIAPDWSPDGSRIVFALDPGNDEFTHPPNRVYVIDADGTDLQLVNDTDDFKRSLDWTD
jgi:Tol biopolymer transport system component